MPQACAVRNCFQVEPIRRGAGPIPASRRICYTVEEAIGWPGLTISPCTRGAPQHEVGPEREVEDPRAEHHGQAQGEQQRLGRLSIVTLPKLNAHRAAG
jgi:hypothetical protein